MTAAHDDRRADTTGRFLRLVVVTVSLMLSAGVVAGWFYRESRTSLSSPIDDFCKWNQPITDADLEQIRQWPMLQRLVLSGTNVTDAGLVHLQSVPQLEILDLENTQVTSVGLANLRFVPKLGVLLLGDTAISDEGLIHFRDVPQLLTLSLSNTKVTDRGLVHLATLKNLQYLKLSGTQVTDVGLAQLAGQTKLNDLCLSSTQINGSGFVHLGRIPLRRLDLNNTKLSDSGVANLRGMSDLSWVACYNTPASDDALALLRQAHPDAFIDGESYKEAQDWQTNEISGVHDPAAPNNKLFQWHTWNTQVPTKSDLPLQLAAALKNDNREVLDFKDFHLTDATKSQIGRLRRVKWLCLPVEITAADLAWICKLTQLRGLCLRGANLTGADFGSLDGLQSLQWLELSRAELTDKEFSTLPRLARLEKLNLQCGPAISDDSLAHLAALRLPGLAKLEIDYSSCTDEGMAMLCSAYNLRSLSIRGCLGITDRSVGSLGRMTSLRWLNVARSGIAPESTETAAVDRLCRLLPQCEVSCWSPF